MKATQPDGTPVVNPTTKVKVSPFYEVEVATTTSTTTTTTTTTEPPADIANLTEIIEPKIIPEIIGGPIWPPFTKTERVPMPVQYYEIPPDGLVKFDLEVPKEAVSFSIEVSVISEKLKFNYRSCVFVNRK